VPERPLDRNQPECIPEIRAALCDHVGIARDALLQQWHQRRRHIQACAVAARRGEIVRTKHPLEAADMIEMAVGDE